MNEGNAAITERRRQTRNKMYRYIYDSRTPVSKQQLAKEMGYKSISVKLRTAVESLVRQQKIQQITDGRKIKYTA